MPNDYSIRHFFITLVYYFYFKKNRVKFPYLKPDPIRIIKSLLGLKVKVLHYSSASSLACASISLSCKSFGTNS